MQPPWPLHRRPLESAVRTERPCPSPMCPHLSHAQAPTIPLIIPGSFSQVIPKTNHSSPNSLPAPEHQTLTNQTQNQGPGPGEDMQGTGAVQLSMGELPQATRNGMFAPATPAPEGSGDLPRPRQAAEQAGEGGTAWSPTQVAHQGQDAGTARAQSTPWIRQNPSCNGKQKHQSPWHPPACPKEEPLRGNEPLWQIKRTKNALLQPGSQDNPGKQMPPQPQLSAQLLKLFQAHLGCPGAL